MEKMNLKILEIIRTEFERPEAQESSRLKEDLYFGEIDYIRLQSKTCYNCFNLKQTGRGLIGCQIFRWEKIYYPQFRGTLRTDFKKYAKHCKDYKIEKD